MTQQPTVASLIKDAVFIIAGVLSADMSIKGFLMSSHFIDGGVTGIPMLLASIVNVPLPIWLLVINLPFIGLGYRRFGRQFAFKSVFIGYCRSLAVWPLFLTPT